MSLDSIKFRWSAIMITTAKENLAARGLVLPDATPPDLPFAPFSLWNGLLMVSGQIPIKDDQIVFIGRVGEGIDLGTAQKAAELCALHAIAQINSACDGDLGRVERILRIGGYVASAPGFNLQTQVINGASELFNNIFGERGRHARTAIGVAGLPLGVAVEIDAVVAIRA
jgi:enamine deaminase RidA (YjgF/YER057c/UK114 family)